MAKAYWVASVDVNDPEVYKQYVQDNAVAFRKYGAKFLVRGGEHEVVDGTYLSSHLIDPDLLRKDDFDAFMIDRQQRLLKLIEEAIGKEAYIGTEPEEGIGVEARTTPSKPRWSSPSNPFRAATVALCPCASLRVDSCSRLHRNRLAIHYSQRLDGWVQAPSEGKFSRTITLN